MRTEPMHYDIEIEEIKSGNTNRALVACWWSGQASIDGWHKMCDCQLGGFFSAKPPHQMLRDKPENWTGVFDRQQNEYLKTNKCKHGVQSRKFRALRAHLPGGEVIEIAA